MIYIKQLFPYVLMRFVIAYIGNIYVYEDYETYIVFGEVVNNMNLPNKGKIHMLLYISSLATYKQKILSVEDYVTRDN